MKHLPFFLELYLTDVANEWYFNRDSKLAKTVKQHLAKEMGWSLKEAENWVNRGLVPRWWYERYTDPVR